MAEAESWENRLPQMRLFTWQKKRLNSGKLGKAQPRRSQKPQPTSNTTSMRGSVVRNTREKLK